MISSETLVLEFKSIVRRVGIMVRSDVDGGVERYDDGKLDYKLEVKLVPGMA